MFSMRNATTNSTADNVANGINFASGARKQIIADNTIALVRPAKGEFAPIFILAAVRAIDPVVALRTMEKQYLLFHVPLIPGLNHGVFRLIHQQ